jgi:hypothetical protein
VGEEVVNQIPGAFWFSPFWDELFALQFLRHGKLLHFWVHF